jgi:hypothetical protein
MQSRLVLGQPRAGDAVTTRPRPSLGGQTVTTRSRPTPGGRHSHDTPEAILECNRQSQLAQGQPRAGDAITAHTRPTPGERHGHNSLETNPRQAVYFRLARGHLERCSGNNRNNLCDIGNVCHTNFACCSYVCCFVFMFHTFFYYCRNAQTHTYIIYV